MTKVLGIDYGEKRVGVAISDSLQIIASSLTTIETKSTMVPSGLILWSFMNSSRRPVAHWNP